MALRFARISTDPMLGGIAERLACSLTPASTGTTFCSVCPVGTFSSAPGTANPETGLEERRALYADSLKIKTHKDLHIV